jgi:hypothetical protein
VRPPTHQLSLLFHQVPVIFKIIGRLTPQKREGELIIDEGIRTGLPGLRPSLPVESQVLTGNFSVVKWASLMS